MSIFEGGFDDFMFDGSAAGWGLYDNGEGSMQFGLQGGFGNLDGLSAKADWGFNGFSNFADSGKKSSIAGQDFFAMELDYDGFGSPARHFGVETFTNAQATGDQTEILSGNQITASGKIGTHGQKTNFQADHFSSISALGDEFQFSWVKHIGAEK